MYGAVGLPSAVNVTAARSGGRSAIGVSGPSDQAANPNARIIVEHR